MKENGINATSWPAVSRHQYYRKYMAKTQQTLAVHQKLHQISRTADHGRNPILEKHTGKLYPIILYDTIPSRLKEVIRMKGHLTKY